MRLSFLLIVFTATLAGSSNASSNLDKVSAIASTQHNQLEHGATRLLRFAETKEEVDDGDLDDDDDDQGAESEERGIDVTSAVNWVTSKAKDLIPASVKNMVPSNLGNWVPSVLKRTGAQSSVVSGGDDAVAKAATTLKSSVVSGGDDAVAKAATTLKSSVVSGGDDAVAKAATTLKSSVVSGGDDAVAKAATTLKSSVVSGGDDAVAKAATTTKSSVVSGGDDAVAKAATTTKSSAVKVAGDVGAARKASSTEHELDVAAKQVQSSELGKTVFLELSGKNWKTEELTQMLKIGETSAKIKNLAKLLEKAKGPVKNELKTRFTRAQEELISAKKVRADMITFRALNNRRVKELQKLAAKAA